MMQNYSLSGDTGVTLIEEKMSWEGQQKISMKIGSLID